MPPSHSSRSRSRKGAFIRTTTLTGALACALLGAPAVAQTAPPPAAPALPETAPETASPPASLPQTASRRVALVIGNAAYDTAPPLPGARTGARRMIKAFRDAGYETWAGCDLTAAGIETLMADFHANGAAGAAVAAVYYAGHGVTRGGAEQMVGVEVGDAGVRGLLPFGLAIETAAAADTAVAIHDAARTAPTFRYAIVRGLHDNDAAARGGGAAWAPTPRNLALIHAAAPGDVVVDGGPNGSALVGALAPVLGLDAPLEELLLPVTREVFRRSEGRQRPFFRISVEGGFTLAAPEGVARPAPLHAMGDGCAGSGEGAEVALSRAAARAMQLRLADLGYVPGEPDGLLGPRSRRALARWQEAEGLPPTGYADAATVGLLLAGAERFTPPVHRTRVAPRPADEAARRSMFNDFLLGIGKAIADTPQE